MNRFREKTAELTQLSSAQLQLIRQMSFSKMWEESGLKRGHAVAHLAASTKSGFDFSL